MSCKFSIINALLLICVTSAEFNLNSLNTATKSLDTFNQSKITLNNTWDYKDDDPISWSAQQHNNKENGKLLLNTTTTRTTATVTATATTKKSSTNYLSNQKPLKMANNPVKQQEPKSHHHQNSNHFYHYLTTIKFNNGNNNENNFNLNNKLKTISTYAKHEDDAKEILQNSTDVEANPAELKSGHAERKQEVVDEQEDEEQLHNVDNFKVKYQTKYYVPANKFRQDDWLGHVPQLQLQTQQLQFFLQQQTLRQTASSSASLLSMAAASLLPHEYHRLADYRWFFNAERHTRFYLHTLTTQNDFVTVSTRQARATASTTFQQPNARNSYKNNYNYKDDYKYDYENPNNKHDHVEFNNNNYNDEDDDDKNDDDAAAAAADDMQMLNLTNARVLNIITDTIVAAFGVNTRPVAAIRGIQIEEIELYNGLSLRQSRFNPFNPCRILIHGWLGGSKAGMYKTLVPEYLKLQQGAYNIFTVDWGKGATADYITASYRVKPVGIIVAKFIDFLHQESGIPFENIHVVGFSMGAHVAGIAGKYIQTGRLAVIYGLDPALPLFRYENINERLDARDANHVEVIHTSVGSYGYDHPLGHVDFYINFGYNQPGCFFNECSHLRAIKVYAQSLRMEILQGKECLQKLWWDMIKHKRCSLQLGRSLRVGVEGLNSKEMLLRRGLYYVMTNSQSPYRMS